MKRTIAPVLTGWLGPPHPLEQEHVTEMRRELRDMKAVIRAAASDPDPHHRVKAALERLDRSRSPGRNRR